MSIESRKITTSLGELIDGAFARLVERDRQGFGYLPIAEEFYGVILFLDHAMGHKDLSGNVLALQGFQLAKIDDLIFQALVRRETAIFRKTLKEGSLATFEVGPDRFSTSSLLAFGATTGLLAVTRANATTNGLVLLFVLEDRIESHEKAFSN